MPRFSFDLSPKEQVIAMLGNLPDDATLDEIDSSIFVLKKATLARQAIRDGHVYTREEAKERLKNWLTD